MAWVPVIDVSQHQGTINFFKMRAAGVRLVIMRVAHGLTKDARFKEYYEAAREAGYEPHEIAFYSFINPKRGSGKATAEFAAQAIFDVTGRHAVGYMHDIESYRNEGPNVGSVVSRTELIRHIKEHRAAFRLVMPGSYQFGYTNRAFWNGPDGPQDAELAASFEWLVPRYPLYSEKAYVERGYPPAPHLWEEYAFKLASGPVPPLGATWQGWQFSAGYNRQGPVYGCSSPDLDLNFVDAEVAQRWFPAPIIKPTPIELEYTRMTAIDGQRIWNGVLRKGVSRIEVPQVPDEATGIHVCLTFRGSLRDGFATLWSGASETPPEVSQLNWKTTATDAQHENGATPVKLLNKGFSVYCFEEVEMIIDLVGYETPDQQGGSTTIVQVSDEHIRAVIAQSIANG